LGREHFPDLPENALNQVFARILTAKPVPTPDQVEGMLLLNSRALGWRKPGFSRAFRRISSSYKRRIPRRHQAGSGNAARDLPENCANPLFDRYFCLNAIATTALT
jgi:hypothetical protein